MIKFEKDNEITFFATAEDVVEWLENEYEKGGRYADLLAEVAETFPHWVNSNYSAYEILTDPEYYTYASLHEDWASELAYDIFHNYILYFTNMDMEIEE